MQMYFEYKNECSDLTKVADSARSLVEAKEERMDGYGHPETGSTTEQKKGV